MSRLEQIALGVVVLVLVLAALAIPFRAFELNNSIVPPTVSKPEDVSPHLVTFARTRLSSAATEALVVEKDGDIRLTGRFMPRTGTAPPDALARLRADLAGLEFTASSVSYAQAGAKAFVYDLRLSNNQQIRAEDAATKPAALEDALIILNGLVDGLEHDRP